MDHNSSLDNSQNTLSVIEMINNMNMRSSNHQEEAQPVLSIWLDNVDHNNIMYIMSNILGYESVSEIEFRLFEDP